MSWTKDNRTMYFTETAESSIFAYDFDARSGQIANKRTFFHVKEPGCAPDGHAMDEEEHLWVAVFGLWKVQRVSPSGQVVAEIVLPTRCVSCTTFVGEDLYITSAEEESPDQHPDSVEHQGNIFRCHVGVKGLPANSYPYGGSLTDLQ